MAKTKTANKGKAKEEFEGMCKWKGGYVKQAKVGNKHVVTVKTRTDVEEMRVNTEKEANELFLAAIATEKK